MNNYQRILLILGVMTFALVKWDSSILAMDLMDNEFTRSTLRGIKGVHVIVQDLKPEIEQNGLTKKQLQTDTELKLRLGRIKVLSEKWAFGESRPLLSVNITVLKDRSGLYIYTIAIDLMQKVFLVRKPNIATVASTWSTGYVGGASYVDAIRKDTKDGLERFVNAYLSVNPK